MQLLSVPGAFKVHDWKKSLVYPCVRSFRQQVKRRIKTVYWRDKKNRKRGRKRRHLLSIDDEEKDLKAQKEW